MVTADGFDEAIIGETTRNLAVYDANKIIAILMERDGMTYDDAVDYFYFNVECAYVGEETPIYMYMSDDFP